nr:auxin-responsive GH3 family protein [Tanacetum cinerariifolium]
MLTVAVEQDLDPTYNVVQFKLYETKPLNPNGDLVKFKLDLTATKLPPELSPRICVLMSLRFYLSGFISMVERKGVKCGGDEKKELLVEFRVLIPKTTFLGFESRVLIPEMTFVDVESRVLIPEATFDIGKYVAQGIDETQTSAIDS